MCDYSLQHVASRPAAAGQRLVTSRFPGSTTRGFTEVGEPAVAICLLPGTEIAFDYEAKNRSKKIGFKSIGLSVSGA